MEQETQQRENPDAVILTAVELCKIHGWEPGNSYAVIDRPINVPDINGYEIWVESSTHKRPVWISESEYQLIN